MHFVESRSILSPQDQKYIRRFGDAYEVLSERIDRLMRRSSAVCRAEGMLFTETAVFDYLRRFESPLVQTSLFSQDPLRYL